MRTTSQVEQPVASADPNCAPRLRVVLADGSVEYMKMVLALSDLHECVDLVGRAANFSEAITLAVNHRPDLLVLDLDMHLANLVVPTVVLSLRTQVRIVGLCIDETISFRQLDCITGVNVLVHRSRFHQEFLSVISMLYRNGDTHPQSRYARVLENPGMKNPELPGTRPRYPFVSDFKKGALKGKP